MDLSILNEQQKEAVECLSGPLLVLAGAGSGKTKVLTYRIANLIYHGVDPRNILAITFTNKAAGEMRDRVIKLIGEEAYKMQLSTFHAFGLKLIRENNEFFHLSNNFSIYDPDDSLSLIKKIMKSLNLSTDFYNAKSIRNIISNCKNELVSPQELNKTEKDENIIKVYSKYNEELILNNAVDFDDLLLLPTILFQNKDILNKYQEKYKYILIDEYQDTNEAQYKLTKMLAKKYQNLCVVGDNDQAIYGFRGANYKNILNFENDYKLAKKIVLDTNYRSTKNILDCANSVIKNNRLRQEKNLKSIKAIGDKTIYYRAMDDDDELSFVSEEIQRLHKDLKVDYKDMIVLYRTNAQSKNFELTFHREGIPAKVVGTLGFYERKEIKDALAYLRLINNTDDSMSLLRVINTPKRGIGEKTVENLINKSNDLGITFYDAIDSGKCLDFKKQIEYLRSLTEKITISEMIDAVLDTTGLRAELVKENTDEAKGRLENLEEFKSDAVKFEQRTGLTSLSEFLYNESLMSDSTENDPQTDSVTLMTVHHVKGLEYPYVFITGLEEGIFPHMMSLEEGNVEEERRLMYVAITRAEKQLYITNSITRLLYGRVNNNQPSRFISEINDDLLDKRISKKQKVNSEYFNYDIPKRPKIDIDKTEDSSEDLDLKVGDNVVSDKFGIGKVLQVEKTVVKVAFSLPYGIRILVKNGKFLHKM